MAVALAVVIIRRRKRGVVPVVNVDPLCDTCGHASEQHVLNTIHMDTLPNGHGAIRWRFRCAGVPVALELGCPCMSFKLSEADVAQRLSASYMEGGVNG